MKKNREEPQRSPKKLELQRETLRRLEPAQLEHAQGARAASRTRPTTDP